MSFGLGSASVQQESGSCKWCYRPFSEDVTRRRPRGAECKSCPVVLAEEYPKDSQDKKGFEKIVREDQGLQREIRDKAERLEEEFRSGVRGRGKWRSSVPQVGVTRVGTTSTSGTRSETPLGVFWPAAQYKEKFDASIPARQRQWRDEGSKRVMGIILPSSHGCPDGCTRLFSTSETTAHRDVELFSSERNEREEAADEVFEAVREKVTLQTKKNKRPVADGGPTSLQVVGSSATPTQKKARTEEDDVGDDLLDLVWGCGFGSGSGGGSGGANKRKADGAADTSPCSTATRASSANKKREKNPRLSVGEGDSKAAASSTSSNDGRAQHPSGSSPFPVSESKRTKELATAEQVALLGDQMLRQLSSAQTFKSITRKSFDALLGKFDNRLAAGIVTVYSQGYIPEGERCNEDTHEGMKVLKKLRNIKGTLDKMAPLVRALGDDADDKATGVAIIETALACKDSASLPDVVFEVGLQRLVDSHAANKEWLELASVLLCSSSSRPLARQSSNESHSSQPDASKYTLNVLPEGARSTFQQRALLKAVIDLTRAENAVADVVALTDCVDTSKLMSAELVTEMQDLKVLSHPWTAQPTESLEALRHKYLTNTAMKLHKGLTLFPTGILIMDVADAVRLKLLDDVQCSKDLDKLTAPGALARDQLASDLGSLTLVQHKAWKKFCSELEKITSKGSESFTTRYESKLAEHRKTIDDAAAALVAKADELIRTAFGNVCGHIGDNDLDIEGFKVECDTFVSNMPSAETLKLTMLSKPFSQEFDEKAEKLKSFTRSLQSGVVAMATPADFDIYDDNVVDLLNVLQAGAPSESPAFGRVAATLKNKLNKFLLVHLKEVLDPIGEICVRMAKGCSFFATAGAPDSKHLMDQECVVEALVSSEHQLSMCDQIIEKYWPVWCDRQEEEAQLTIAIKSGDVEVGVPLTLALRAPKVHQILHTSLKFTWTTAEAAADHILETIPALWEAVCEMRAFLDKIPEEKRDVDSCQYLDELLGEFWPWLVSLADTGVSQIAKPMTQAFDNCCANAKSEVLGDMYTIAKTKQLGNKATVNQLFGKTSTSHAKNLFNNWKTYQNLLASLQDIQSVLGGLLRGGGEPAVTMLSTESANILATELAKKDSTNYKQVQQVLGLLTAAQALWRQLRTGETRSGLCRSALARRRDMHLPGVLKRRLAQEAGITLPEDDLKDDGEIGGDLS